MVKWQGGSQALNLCPWCLENALHMTFALKDLVLVAEMLYT